MSGLSSSIFLPSKFHHRTFSYGNSKKPSKLKKIFLDQNGKIFQCLYCGTHIGMYDDVISKTFQGKAGRGFLMNMLVNIQIGECHERHLLTGKHFVSDIQCGECNHALGWKYERALEPSQKYKEGKFVLEKCNVRMDCMI